MGLSLLLREPVWTLPHQNYSTALKRFALYGVPPAEELPFLGLALIAEKSRPPEWIFALLRQMAHSIALECAGPVPQRILAPVELTARQKAVLLCIARGITDQAAALDLGVSLDTVRYHKKRLYRALNADSGVKAVVNALLMGCLTLEEIPF